MKMINSFLKKNVSFLLAGSLVSMPILSLPSHSSAQTAKTQGEIRYEAENATLPEGSNVVVRSESGMSNGSYAELTRETGEQRNSILVFEDAMDIKEPGMYQVDIGYKTENGDYKKQLLKIIEPMDAYTVEKQNLKNEAVVQQISGEFQSSGWVEKEFIFKIDKPGLYDFEIQGDWAFQDIDYIDVHSEKKIVNPIIDIEFFRFYQEHPEDLTFKYEDNYNNFTGLKSSDKEISNSLYSVNKEKKEITIKKEFFLEAKEKEGTIQVLFDNGESPQFSYIITDALSDKSIYQAEEGSILGGSTIKYDAPSQTKYVSIESEGGVQWGVQVPEDGRYQLKIRYRASSGDKVQDIIVKNDEFELKYGTGFPITPFSLSNEDSRDGWEVIKQEVEMKAGFNSIEIRRNWGFTDIDYLKIGDDPNKAIPFYENALISPSRDTYNQNDPRDLNIHLEENGNTLTEIKTENGRKLAFRVEEFQTSDLDSGYKANKRNVVLPNDQLKSLPLGKNKLIFQFSNGATATYTVDVRKYVEQGELQIVSFEVGHGNATLFKLPNGKNLLVDSGKEEAAGSVVLPYLKKHHIKLDYYMLTHFHDDHRGKLEQILQENNLNRISKEEAYGLIKKDKQSRYDVLRNTQYLDNTMLLPGDKVEEIWDLGGVTMQIMQSRYDMEGNENSDLDENNISMASMIEYKGF
ncbi:MBL fold metallo-hydrolase [Bacillaceae bacterium Marseille-Q3522]|nr:MBL fold metallo-hydrolase [Bacillaceae bacterium Marseille-Q3522]